MTASRSKAESPTAPIRGQHRARQEFHGRTLPALQCMIATRSLSPSIHAVISLTARGSRGRGGGWWSGKGYLETRLCMLSGE